MIATPLNNVTLEVINESAPWNLTSAAEEEMDKKDKENKEVKPKARPRPKGTNEEEEAKKKGTDNKEMEKKRIMRHRCRWS